MLVNSSAQKDCWDYSWDISNYLDGGYKPTYNVWGPHYVLMGSQYEGGKIETRWLTCTNRTGLGAPLCTHCVDNNVHRRPQKIRLLAFSSYNIIENRKSLNIENQTIVFHMFCCHNLPYLSLDMFTSDTLGVQCGRAQ